MNMLTTTSLIFYASMVLEISYFQKGCFEVEVDVKCEEKG